MCTGWKTQEHARCLAKTFWHGLLHARPCRHPKTIWPSWKESYGAPWSSPHSTRTRGHGVRPVLFTGNVWNSVQWLCGVDTAWIVMLYSLSWNLHFVTSLSLLSSLHMGGIDSLKGKTAQVYTHTFHKVCKIIVILVDLFLKKLHSGTGTKGRDYGGIFLICWRALVLNKNGLDGHVREY